MKVLIADDSEIMRSIITGVLFQIGITDVVEAEDGQKAVDILMELDIDLALIDWDMPVMPGILALRGIRSSGMHLPVIMMLTLGEELWEEDALMSGATACIRKPFRPETLAAEIQKISELVW